MTIYALSAIWSLETVQFLFSQLQRHEWTLWFLLWVLHVVLFRSTSVHMLWLPLWYGDQQLLSETYSFPSFIGLRSTWRSILLYLLAGLWAQLWWAYRGQQVVMEAMELSLGIGWPYNYKQLIHNGHLYLPNY